MTPSPTRHLAGAVLALASVTACGRERDRTAAEPCPTWQGEIAALVAERCGACHSGTGAAASYRLDDYLGVLGGGSDGVANAVAGDAASTLLAVLTATNPTHAAVAETRAGLATWVVECRLDYGASRLHQGGLMNPADPDFHGTLLRDTGWDFALCQGCHGDPRRVDDFSGGTSGAACTTCHAGGPTACRTCHETPPPSGAHAAHATAGPLDRPTPCAECHVVPARWDAPGHLLRDGAVDAPPVEVSLGALAARDLEPPRRTGPPAYDAATGRCDNVYCHGGALGDSAAAAPAPIWTETGAASCGGCHGVPPASHPSGACVTCHPAVVAPGGALVLARHLDGAVQLADAALGCVGCHGQGSDPAPPRALDGAQASSALGVGAHQAHLGASALRGPIACTECHVVPAATTSAGHLDSALPAEVFAPGAGLLARADGATPAWDHATATCSGVYCHGGGAKLAGDGASGLARAPVWTRVDFGEAACGTCHGVPPGDAAHPPPMDLGDCNGCHSASVTASGGIILTGPAGAEASHHIDGVVDVD